MKEITGNAFICVSAYFIDIWFQTFEKNARVYFGKETYQYNWDFTYDDFYNPKCVHRATHSVAFEGFKGIEPEFFDDRIIGIETLVDSMYQFFGLQNYQDIPIVFTVKTKDNLLEIKFYKCKNEIRVNNEIVDIYNFTGKIWEFIQQHLKINKLKLPKIIPIQIGKKLSEWQREYEEQIIYYEEQQ